MITEVTFEFEGVIGAIAGGKRGAIIGAVSGGALGAAAAKLSSIKNGVTKRQNKQSKRQTCRFTKRTDNNVATTRRLRCDARSGEGNDCPT